MPDTPPAFSHGVTAADLAGDAIQPGDPLFGTVWINPERMSGTPCFFGTRVPIKHLFDYLAGGHPMADFFDDFPEVTRQQVDTLFDRALERFRPQGHAA